MPYTVQVPELVAYLQRINAHELGFRRYMVRQYHDQQSHYYYERCTVRVHGDGSISCTDQSFAPTEEEATAIQTALANVNWPHSIKASASQFRLLLDQRPNTSTLFEFYDRVDGQIIMAQERCMIQERKAYVPWSFWSDGEWRCMEPDEKLLPFWKPRQRTGNYQHIMIHEGAKTASFVHGLCTNPERLEELKSHPWGADLVKWEHWGMIGGALVPHRANYAELHMERPDEVVYICDNDFVGKDALKSVSKHYGKNLKGVYFDNKFPTGWDMADVFPAKLFDNGRYQGSRLREYFRYATFATKQERTGQKGKPKMEINECFAKEWFHSITPDCFIHKDWPIDLLNESEFNDKCQAFSHTQHTSNIFKSTDVGKTAQLRYSPAQASGLFNDGAQNCINTYMAPWWIEAEQGSVSPWLEFMEYLIPSQHDREETLRWCATLLARPDIKMHYGLLLIGETQGVGKTTLGERILAPLLGLSNVSFPSENDIVESSFNDWAAHKRLAIIHEIYAGHSNRAYNKLKSVVTDKHLSVNKKYLSTYKIENWLHIFASSNSMRALHLDNEDRRWLVPKVTTVRLGAAYWLNFFAWLERAGGLQFIKYWAQDWVAHHDPVTAGVPAPMTAAKLAVIEEGYSPGQMLVANFLDYVKDGLQPNEQVLITDVSLVQLIKDRLYDGRHSERLEKSLTLRRLARARGWYATEERLHIRSWGMDNAYILTNDPALAHQRATEIQATGLRPLDVQAKAREMGSL